MRETGLLIQASPGDRIVVNAEARRNAGVGAGDVVTITLEPDEKREKVSSNVRRRMPDASQRRKGKAPSSINGLKPPEVSSETL